MKIRTGFVSNSSSSSFIVPLSSISAEQKAQIYNHIEEAKKIAVERGFSVQKDDGVGLAVKDGGYSVCWVEGTDAWEISEDSENLRGYTNMDNFDMGWFLEMIGLFDVEFEEC